MNIEEELLDLLDYSIRGSDNKYRDIQLILFFFGFRGEQWPTLEDAAIKFDVGESEKRRSERPRQIIKNKFTSKVDISQLPVARKVSEVIESTAFVTVNELSDKLTRMELVPDKFSIKGLLNLLQQLGLCENYNIYTNTLVQASRNTIGLEKKLYVLNSTEVNDIRAALRMIMVFPGLVGIANFCTFFEKNKHYKKYEEILLDILRSKNEAWISTIEGQIYYIIEDRENTLINNLEKIKNIASSVNIDTLSIVLANAFKRRTSPKGNNYPNINVIESYLKYSRFTNFNGTTVKLKLEATSLNEIEQDVIDFMRGKGPISFVDVKNYLETLSYSKPSIDKAILNSPLVYADKSLRKSYTYTLLGSDNYEIVERLERYSLFKEKLLNICEDGTDSDTSANRRKEQHILREWLFGDKDTEKCASCKNEFSTQSLVTAHKKPRAMCSFNERVDPYIVMPMCKFGCDHLYELGVIKVQNGVICSNLPIGSGFESQYVSSLLGKPLDQQWLEGNQNYFETDV
ncbi:hypothetical protein BS333_21180 (plasmid) [Vibrio azureus]|uniref:Uncharacterized protein n=1 Tax=Vibrio azureus NBRC 104587 TaxID=1219077 RepID=U3AXT0_9VIBR|nr:hypothetical protein [Vibrio azureus]AUI88890.1 hypothetical protein BS333_21180 [Vibrio azureus]GAD78037.1 hypothetical protein VAZ01S_114_00020 [Vibrio azureus NBRC 104587]